VAERTRVINRLRWHLHELDPGNEPPARNLWRPKHLYLVAARLANFDGIVARLASELVASCRQLTGQIRELDDELVTLVAQLAPALLSINGCATLTAAKILSETADVRRFRSRHAFARHNGTAPLSVWSSNHPRHRLSRTGNRQINAAIHRIAITQAHWHQPT
jgi:transposase